ncbi:MAG: response regulator [Polyangiaceae bacterium]|nr:response regulator [Polyangiaceae bacterium]
MTFGTVDDLDPAAALAAAAADLGVGLIEVVAERRIAQANAAAEWLTGYPAAELPGRELDALLPLPEVVRRLDAAGDPSVAVSSTIEPATFETTLVRRDGQRAIVSVAIRSLADRLGCCVLAVRRSELGRVRDDRLARSEARFRELIDGAPQPIWVLDRERVLYGNQAYLELFDAVASPDGTWPDLRSFLDPSEVARFDDRHAQLRMSGEPPGPSEFRVHRGDGSVLVLEVSSVAGEIDGSPAVFCFGRDVTERVRKETHALQTDRLSALGLLAGGMAHAINNPLTYVLLNLDHVAAKLAQVAEDPTLVQETTVRLLEAQDGAERVAEVVRHMRALSRTDDADRGPVDVAELLRNAIGVVGNEVRHRGTLLVDLGEVSLVVGSAARLEQVFLGLLVQAARSLPESAQNAEIHVVLRQVRDQVIVELTDAGPTLEADLVARVTDPSLGFVPGKAWAWSGLSLGHGIVRSLGGTLQIESDGAGHNIFRVALPAARPGVEVAPPSHDRFDSEPPPSLEFRPRVLVIDDDPGVVSALRLMLEGEHEVTTVASGREALRLLLSEPPYDVVFSDLMMPGVSGMDLFEAVRLNRPGIERRLVFMTGGAFTPEAARFLERVPNGRVEKPFDLARVSRLLTRAVRAGR